MLRRWCGLLLVQMLVIVVAVLVLELVLLLLTELVMGLDGVRQLKGGLVV